MARASGAATRLFEIIDRRPAMPPSTCLLKMGRVHSLTQAGYSFGAVGDAVTRAFPSSVPLKAADVSSASEIDSQTFELKGADIVFENVSFAYPDRPDKLVLKNLSCSIPVGAHVAVVGASGSGKSTLTKLITRLYDPTEGRVLIGGVDVKKYVVLVLS